MNGDTPQSTGNLYLIPNTLGKTQENTVIPEYVVQIIRRLRVLVVENIQAARRYLQWLGETVPEYEIRFFVLNKHTKTEEIAGFLEPALKGEDTGLISDAGCPAVADPGSTLVREAHSLHIRVIPLTGPNSMMLALMASGFNGQSFAFWGYLPVSDNERNDMLRHIEKESRQINRSQIMMEAPHRNPEFLEAILDVCADDTYLCLATDITLASESIISLSIKDWKQHSLPDLLKRPTVFILYAGEMSRITKSGSKKRR